MILITGATGHVGNVLARTLSRLGYPLRVLALPSESIDSLRGINATIYCADVCNKEQVREAVRGCDTVFHLAGFINIAPGNREKVFKVNVEGTKTIADVCLEESVSKFIYVSSVHAFIEPKTGDTLTEDCALGLRKQDVLGSYAQSKALATAYVLQMMEKGLNAVILYPSGICGPFDFKRSELGMFLRWASSPGKVKFYFNGGYDYVDVRDVVDGLIKAWQNGTCGRGYILSGQYVTVKDMYEGVAKATQRTFRYVKLPRALVFVAAAFAELYYSAFRKKPVFTRYSIEVLFSNGSMSNKKAAGELGFTSRSFDDTVKDSLLWLDTFRPVKKRLRSTKALTETGESKR
ncbi:MAG: NAD-dependent epimerase/dehydratase family protein [Christensenellales bacterium]